MTNCTGHLTVISANRQNNNTRYWLQITFPIEGRTQKLLTVAYVSYLLHRILTTSNFCEIESQNRPSLPSLFPSPVEGCKIMIHYN